MQLFSSLSSIYAPENNYISARASILGYSNENWSMVSYVRFFTCDLKRDRYLRCDSFFKEIDLVVKIDLLGAHMSEM